MPSPIRLIVIGGDIGAYGTARAFHEAYGTSTVVVGGVSTGAVAHSRVVDHRVVQGLEHEDTLVQTVRSIAAEQPKVRHLVLGSADQAVHALVTARSRLQAPGVDLVVPYADAAIMSEVTTKAGFSRLCQELDIPHPATVVVRVGATAAAHVELPPQVRFPVVVKASSTAEFHRVDFEGKRKVAYVEDRAALESLLRRMSEAGFTGEVVVQERIDGTDEDMAAVNAFCGADGDVRFLLFGRVLLEEATPNGLGNSVAQITGGSHAHDEAVAHARRLLEHVGWTGFANIDLKRDPRDGRYRFFELNPRVGRSGYAVTAAGYNVARMYAQGYGPQPLPAMAEPEVGESEHLFTVVPLALLRRYVSAASWQSVKRLRSNGQVTNLYYYAPERDPRRWGYIATAMLNQFRKFRTWHRGGQT